MSQDKEVLVLLRNLFVHYMEQTGSLSLSRIRLFVALWTVAHQVPLPMGFSRQEYWSGLPCPPPGGLPNPGIEPASLASPALGSGFFTTVPPGTFYY